jgi:ubiquinone/menaquinone biosynthesis C-methylase UbiE
MEESSFLNPGAVLTAAELHEGMQVADFGAGSGFFTRAAARIIGEAGVVWALDINPDLLPRIKNLAEAEGLNNVEVVRGDAEILGGSNLPSESFDLVIAANLLFMAGHKHEVIAEMHRVLRPSGRALIVDWSDSWGGLGPHPEHVVSYEEALAAFQEEGFAYVKDVPAGAYHWGFIVRKKPQRSAQ